MRPVYNYKKLLSERLRLQVARRAARLSRGTKLVDVEYSDLILRFSTRSGTDPVHVVWHQTVKLNLSNEKLMSLKTYNDVRKAMLEGALKVHCDCPAWLYWGMQYKGTKLGYALVPERRRPTKSNRMPGVIPYVCKHLFLVLQVFPFLVPQISSKLKKKLDEAQKKREKELANKAAKDKELLDEDLDELEDLE